MRSDETIVVVLFHPMDPIVGNAPTPTPLHAPHMVDLRTGSRRGRLSVSELSVTEGLLACMGRWGLSKTTMDDVAREAGLSRATVYRLFPGGKSTILAAAAAEQVRVLVDALCDELAGATDLEDCLVSAVHLAASFLDRHEALSYMREHETVAFERLVSFDRLEAFLAMAAQLLGPVLAPFMIEADSDSDVSPGVAADEVAVWLTRLVVSYLSNPSPWLDLTDRDDVSAMVRSFVLPGVSVPLADRPARP